jgi:uncharacterized iron-regulated membrane protein
MSQEQTKTTSTQRQAKVLRISRKIHRLMGVSLFVFLIFISVTGLLLGWKKNSGDIILAKTYEGTSKDLNDWLPIHELDVHAEKAFRDSISATLPYEIDRIDIRKEKGTVKFTFKTNFYGIQLDGATGKVLFIEKRRSDFIEKIHDGSIVDYYLNISNGIFKLIYTTLLGSALFIFSVTGFWLWYGPKKLRSSKRQS